MNKSEMLINFSRLYTLDGDILRCTHCKRGQHISHQDEDNQHRSDCRIKEFSFKRPWLELKWILNKEQS